MTPERADALLAEALRARLQRVAAILAARAPLSEAEARNLLEVELSAAVSEATADVLGDLDRLDGD